MDTILLIEDHQVIRENTAELLQMAGYAVLTAENGELGVKLALATPPDLVICDIMMPVLDGYGVLQIFNQNARLAGVPFIFLTAKTERTEQRHGMALGADDYLTKPFVKAELLSAVQGRLHRFEHLRPVPDLPLADQPAAPDMSAPASSLADLNTGRKTHLIRRKQIIYLAGDEPTRLYFVQRGRVKTVKTTESGKELILQLHGPGEFFGYLPLLRHTRHPESAVAVDETELLYVPAEEFMALQQRDAVVSRQLVQLLAGQVSGQAEHLLALAYSSIRRRVADALVQLHEQAGPAAAIQLSRDDMAAMVGTAPESLSRTLTEFRQSGLIELSPNTIRVLQPDTLRRAHW